MATPEPAPLKPADDPSAPAAPPHTVASGDRGCEPAHKVLPLVEETLRVDKATVAQGGFRITKRVDTRVELVDELLRGQSVEVERRPIGRPLEADELPEPRYEGNTLIVPVVEEVLVTEKRLVLVEEVRITRIEGTHRRPQQVTLRKEEISIERLDAAETSAPESPSYAPTAGG